MAQLKEYEPYTGAETIDRILGKAKELRDLHVVHVNSTYYGGDVAELLAPSPFCSRNFEDAVSKIAFRH